MHVTTKTGFEMADANEKIKSGCEQSGARCEFCRCALAMSCHANSLQAGTSINVHVNYVRHLKALWSPPSQVNLDTTYRRGRLVRGTRRLTTTRSV